MVIVGNMIPLKTHNRDFCRFNTHRKTIMQSRSKHLDICNLANLVKEGDTSNGVVCVAGLGLVEWFPLFIFLHLISALYYPLIR